MAAAKKTTEWVARVGDETFPVVTWLTDAGSYAKWGRPAALVVVDGALIDSEQLKQDRRQPVLIERA